jgi:hypothetical protein
MMIEHENNKERKRGQVMLEYVMSVLIFLGVIILAGVLLNAFQDYGNRALFWIGSEYP